MVFFEGSEKKIEVIFDPSLPSLRQLPSETWHQLVEAAHAKILSSVTNEQMDAYLLSESSLFVYDHYLVMITCGTTRLIDAAEFLVKKFSQDAIQAFFYERKNEILPHAQPSHFLQDVEQLKTWFDGEAMRFGHEDEHHLFLFSTTKAYKPDPNDHTMEILMHGVEPKVLQMFQDCKGCSKEDLRQQSGISEIVKGKIDDYVFEPMGYSLNSIDGGNYYTIHITPQKFGNYTSFETNGISPEQQPAWAKKVLEVFRPTNFDLVLFNQNPLEIPQFENYQLKRRYKSSIEAGYSVQYLTYFLPQSHEQEPFRF